jgi:hypothetical protein
MGNIAGFLSKEMLAFFDNLIYKSAIAFLWMRNGDRILQQISSKPTTRLNELILSSTVFNALHT